MIIREQDTHIIMIEQDDHAHISEEIIRKWSTLFFENDPHEDAVLYAVRNHDYGWKAFDLQPFWNDQTGLPFDFTTFPHRPKTVLYTKGVDDVQEVNPYAAALCSAHYMTFMERGPKKEVQQYLKKEQHRIDTILASIPGITKETFQTHLAMLQFADNMSLYICVNDPGVSKKDEHAFFKKGIPISTTIPSIEHSIVDAYWCDIHTISLKGLPYVHPFQVYIPYKSVEKKSIESIGIMRSYEEAPLEQLEVTIQIEHI